MALRDEGRLRLDDTLDRYIPESRHGGITIRQMLSHVAGMPHEPRGDVLDTLVHPNQEELIDGWNETERILRPHVRWHYSSLTYSMLGEVVARLDGRSWWEALKARILDPLELRRTTLGLGEKSAVGYFVSPFSDVPVLEPVIDNRAMGPAGALASTIDDMTAWGSFIADPTAEVLSEDTVEEMCQPQVMVDLRHWQLAWGLGLMLVREGDRVWVGHTGAAPGHSTGFMVQRETKTVAGVLMNSTSAPDPADLAIELGKHVLDNDVRDTEPWRPSSEVPPELAGLIGRWFAFGESFTFSVRAGRLEARAEQDPDWMPSSVFAPIGDDLYRVTAGPEMGELLRVSRDDAGAVTHVNWATYRYTREPTALGAWLADS